MLRSAMVSALVIGAPMAAQANELSFSWGATIASEYVSSGVYYSDGPTFQPYVELGFGGFYTGLYAANTEPDLVTYSTEIGTSLGYRGVVGPVNYDVSLNYYVYNNGAEDSAEFITSANIAATESLYVTGRVALAPEYDGTNLRLRADYYTAVEGLSVGAAYGTNNTNYGDWSYWNIDASYAVSDSITLGLGYHDSTYDEDVSLGVDGNGVDGGLIVGSVGFSF